MEKLIEKYLIAYINFPKELTDPGLLFAGKEHIEFPEVFNHREKVAALLNNLLKDV